MKIQEACHRGDPRYSFHGDEIAEIVGVRVCSPSGDRARLCFVVRFANGDEDFVPVVDDGAGFVCTSDGLPVNPDAPRFRNVR